MYKEVKELEINFHGRIINEIQDINFLINMMIKSSYMSAYIALNNFNESYEDFLKCLAQEQMYIESRNKLIRDLQSKQSNQFIINVNDRANNNKRIINQAVKELFLNGIFVSTHIPLQQNLLYANSFLYSLDSIMSAIKVLKEITTENNYSLMKASTTAYDLVNATYPDLRKIRNSAHHLEDRIRLLKSERGKLLPINPVNNKMSINSLNGVNLSYTIDDGSIASIPVNEHTLATFAEAIQIIVNNLNYLDNYNYTIPYQP